MYLCLCVSVFVDYIVVGSDSGRIVILEYHPSKNMFEKIHQETFGKSGCRRIVPGQFLAVDPKGRAVMIGTNSYQRVLILEQNKSITQITKCQYPFTLL